MLKARRMVRNHATRPIPPYFLVPAVLAGVGVLLPLVYLLLRAFEADPKTLAELVLR
ncbi:MAG: iron ABC transporter permease, partial [Meiothermus silvanus]|nr:iron ABC transporter permease [Allomeiothermus silvanus]